MRRWFMSSAPTASTRSRRGARTSPPRKPATCSVTSTDSPGPMPASRMKAPSCTASRCRRDSDQGDGTARDGGALSAPLTSVRDGLVGPALGFEHAAATWNVETALDPERPVTHVVLFGIDAERPCNALIVEARDVQGAGLDTPVPVAAILQRRDDHAAATPGVAIGRRNDRIAAGPERDVLLFQFPGREVQRDLGLPIDPIGRAGNLDQRRLGFAERLALLRIAPIGRVGPAGSLVPRALASRVPVRDP